MSSRALRIVPPLAVALFVSAGSGCVSKKKYDELQREFDDATAQLQGTLAERDAKILSLEEAIAAEEALRNACDQRVMDLEAELQPLRDELEDMRAAKDQAETALAEALASKKNLKASIEEMKVALAEASARRAAAERRIKAYRAMLRKFKHLIDAGKLEVQVVDGRMVLVLPTDVLFASGRAKLSEDGRGAVMEVGAALATMSGRRFQVEGHTDTDPISTANYPSNWELASDRAMGVVRALLEAGVAPGQVSAASYGEHRPALANDTAEGKAKNRRIEIVIVPDLSGLPGFDELTEMARPDRIPPKKK
jgi:chemotaxis protein MotB